MEAGDFNAAARALTHMAELEENPRRGAQFHVELGRLYDDQLEEHARAIQCFEIAIQLDADNVDAAFPLAREYANQGRWAEAEPQLRLLVRSSASREPAEQHDLWLLYGQCAEQLRDDDIAVRAFGKAFELDPQDLTALRGLAAAHYAKKNWDQAFKFYQMVLVHHLISCRPPTRPRRATASAS
jgi:tetratricopeptide (TPR) repeat protein